MDIYGSILSINWLSTCGTGQRPIPCGFQIGFQTSKRVALESIVSPEWEDFQLEQTNRRTEFLSLSYPDQDRDYNTIVNNCKLFLEVAIWGRVEAALQGFESNQRARQEMLNSIKWDVLGAMVESEYVHVRKVELPPPFFSLELLKVYVAGGLPCGWIGDYPSGTLIVL